MKIFLTMILAACCFAASTTAQTIESGKSLQISITGVPVSEKGRLDNTYSVSSGGYITMWKIGPVKAAGLTKEQLANSIAQKYRAAEIYTDPVFQIFSPEDDAVSRNKFVTVGGQVRRPGQTPYTKGLTLFGAIQAAGGETPYGAMNRVKLYRKGRVYEFDMKKRESKAVPVYAHDTIEVPQSNIIGR